MKKLITVLLVSLLVLVGCSSKSVAISEEDVTKLHESFVHLISSEGFLFEATMDMNNLDYDKNDATDFKSSSMQMVLGVNHLNTEQAESKFEMIMDTGQKELDDLGSISFYTVGNQSYMSIFGQKIKQDLEDAEETPVDGFTNAFKDSTDFANEELSSETKDLLLASLDVNKKGSTITYVLKDGSPLKTKMQEAFKGTQNEEVSSLLGISDDNTELEGFELVIEDDKISNIILNFSADIMGKKIKYVAKVDVKAYGEDVDLQLPSFDDYVEMPAFGE